MNVYCNPDCPAGFMSIVPSFTDTAGLAASSSDTSNCTCTSVPARAIAVLTVGPLLSAGGVKSMVNDPPASTPESFPA